MIGAPWSVSLCSAWPSRIWTGSRLQLPTPPVRDPLTRPDTSTISSGEQARGGWWLNRWCFPLSLWPSSVPYAFPKASSRATLSARTERHVITSSDRDPP
jgi:hypothetical protein